MSELTDFAENWIINNRFSPCYVGLFSVMPTDAGGGTEVTATINGTGTRPAASFATASGSSGQVANTGTVSFGNAAGGATIVGFGLFDAATAGNLLAYSTLTGGNATVTTGSAVSFATGALTFTIA